MGCSIPPVLGLSNENAKRQIGVLTRFAGSRKVITKKDAGFQLKPRAL